MSRPNIAPIHRQNTLRGAKETGQTSLRAILYEMIGRLVQNSFSPIGSSEAHVHQALEEAVRNLPHWLEGIVFGYEFNFYYRKAVQSLIKGKVRCSALADDLAQETLLRVLRVIRSGKRLPKHRKAWLCRIANNVVNDHFRKQGRRKEVGLPDPENISDARTAVRLGSGEADLAEYLEILEHLAGKELADLVRLRLEGHSNEEIAEKKRVDVRTIERRRHRLRDIVRNAGFFV